MMADLYDLDDAVAARAFRKLVLYLRSRDDLPNVTLMGEAGFCRNCLADWIAEAAAKLGTPMDKEASREIVYGMPYAEWKAAHQQEATVEQLAKMERSVAINAARQRALDEALDESFPASDPPSMTQPK